MANKMRTGDGKFRPLAPPPEASTRIRTRRHPCSLDIHRAVPPVEEADGPEVAENRSDTRDLHRRLLLRHRLHLR